MEQIAEISLTFFGGHGAMALVAAWWGIWHILAGVAVARFFTYQDGRRVAALREQGA